MGRFSGPTLEQNDAVPDAYRSGRNESADSYVPPEVGHVAQAGSGDRRYRGGR